ncbi:hypothetical protein HOY80DRAFT_1046830 [Tuber brumale]|nr:hypothetical protein HOY80DRAFT_1046830 [Tuber brumale]
MGVITGAHSESSMVMLFPLVLKICLWLVHYRHSAAVLMIRDLLDCHCTILTHQWVHLTVLLNGETATITEPGETTISMPRGQKRMSFTTRNNRHFRLLQENVTISKLNNDAMVYSGFTFDL